MAGKFFDVFGWTTSYTTNAYSGAPLKFNLGSNYKTKIVFQAYIDALAAAAKLAADSKKAADDAAKAIAD